MSGPNTPVAIIAPTEQEVVVGSIVKLDGRLSTDPNNLDLYYSWGFSQVPIGSQVAALGFTAVEDDFSVVSFAPDLSGTYKIQLVVSNGSQASSAIESIVDVRIILVPYHQGIIPDASFIWNYLSDFWNLVPDKKRFETVWSSIIQVTSSELLKAYQYQYNQSIRDIQETIQKKWVSFSPSLDFDRSLCSFILSEETAGLLASTAIIDSVSGVAESIQPTFSSIVTIPKTEGDFSKTTYGSPTSIGRLLVLGKRTFTSARISQTFLSLDSNSDGVTSGTNVFIGSGFQSSMIGSTLRIISPPSNVVGDYPITGFTDSAHIIITPPSGVTWAGITNIKYSVLPNPSKHTSFFADRDQVPAGLSNQHWRMSSTLISAQYNFDNQGVSIGDVIEIEVLRTDLQLLSTFFVQVTGVDRNRLSFVLNLKDLVDGIAAPGLTSDIQTTLAADLIVPGISADINGNLTYSLDAANVNTTVTSIKFKRTYFEKILTPADEINVGPFSIQARPVRVIRNTKIAIDPSVVSIPILQEYVKQPSVSQDGDTIFFIDGDGNKTQVPRLPYLLAENLDYIIDNETSIIGICQTVQNSDIITIPFGDLLDRSVSEGDSIEVIDGTDVSIFNIRQVLSSTTIRVVPVPSASSTTSTFTITRRIPGKFIRFIDDAFSKTAPAPTRLWSEVTYFDNGEAIEGNFGILVGVRREDLKKVGSDISYKNAVAGLMYALSQGPTISNLGLAGHILLGLPFSSSAGVITDINPSFRKNSDGSPSVGRILISGRDKSGLPTGITNIYFYPQGRQLFDSTTNKWIPAVPDFSGLEINPATGIEYAIGDSVTQFAPLAKGVSVRDYKSTPTLFDNLIAQGNIPSQLKKYHSFQVVVNSDIISSVDVDLVAQFLKKAKAHYVMLISALLKSFDDFVDVEDTLTFSRPVIFSDSPDLGTPLATKVDKGDESLSVISLDGIFYNRYHYGNDLSTTQGSSTVQSLAGGFINPRSAFKESWDSPLLLAGDVLKIISGHNAGYYSISSVVSDTSLILSLGSTNFETLQNQEFRVFRPLKNPIWSGTISVTNTGSSVTTGSGIGSSGVSVGDTLVFADFTTINSTISNLYTILSVNPSTTSVTVTPSIAETSGSYSAWIIRDGIMTSGSVSGGTNFFVNGTSGSSYLTFTDTVSHHNSWLDICLLRINSKITINNIPYYVLRNEPGLRRVAVTTPLLATYSDQQVTIDIRPDRPLFPLAVDLIDRMPSDYLKLELVASPTTGDKVQVGVSLTTLTLTVQHFSALGVKPGDFIQFLEGPDSTRDVGNGPGTFLISQIVSDTVTLLDTMTTTGTYRYGIIRKVPK